MCAINLIVKDNYCTGNSSSKLDIGKQPSGTVSTYPVPQEEESEIIIGAKPAKKFPAAFGIVKKYIHFRRFSEIIGGGGISDKS